MIAGNSLAKLLHGPPSCRMLRYVAVQNSPCADLHDHKDVQHAEARRHHGGEIAGDDGVRVISYEGFPALSRYASRSRVPVVWPILLHGAWRHQNSQLQRQFVGYTFLSPRRI